MGNGRNLKTFARNVLKLKQQLQPSQHQPSPQQYHGILMDLRGHGKSYNYINIIIIIRTTTSTYISTLCTRCGTYIIITRRTRGIILTPSTDIVVGHSWGGRIALEYGVVRSTSGNPLQSIWLLDTVPGQAHESVDQVIHAVTEILAKSKENNNKKLLDRKELINLLTQTYNMDMGIAQWLASSYNNQTGDFGFDMKLVQDIKPEFANQDFIGLLRIILQSNEKRLAEAENEDSNTTPTTITKIHLVRGGKNKAWSVDILRQLEALVKEYPTTFYMHVLPSAGHWVHVDDLPGLVDLFAKHSTTTTTNHQQQQNTTATTGRRQFSTIATSRRSFSSSSSSSGKDQHAFFQQQLKELEKERVSIFSSDDEDDEEEGDSSDTTSTTKSTNASASNEVFIQQMQEWKSEQKIIFGKELDDHEATTTPESSKTALVDDDEEEEEKKWEEMKEERELLFQFSSEERAAWGDIPEKNSMKELLKEVAKARAAIENGESTDNDKESPSDSFDGTPTVTSSSPTDEINISVEDHHHESFSHVSGDGKSIHMVDVGHKTVSRRMAHARTSVILPRSVLEAFGLQQNGTGSTTNELVGPKGPIFATAKIAGIMAAKNTSNLIPLCHPLPLDQVQIDIRLDEQTGVVTIDCTCRVHHKTGVEMEALTGASIAALTIYDMTKAVSHEICITDTKLVSKTGGKRNIEEENDV